MKATLIHYEFSGKQIIVPESKCRVFPAGRNPTCEYFAKSFLRAVGSYFRQLWQKNPPITDISTYEDL
ncbi:MAG: hypothetical protein J7K40_04105 [candidate division Zixibacteria bacterium]|nr:hypothetical protein [candidate division Zixibacteria bacterium]